MNLALLSVVQDCGVHETWSTSYCYFAADKLGGGEVAQDRFSSTEVNFTPPIPEQEPTFPRSCPYPCNHILSPSKVSAAMFFALFQLLA